MGEIEKIVENLEKEIQDLIYKKLRIYSDIGDIKFNISYDYIKTTTVSNTTFVKRENNWNPSIKIEDN